MHDVVSDGRWYRACWVLRRRARVAALRPPSVYDTVSTYIRAIVRMFGAGRIRARVLGC